MNAGVLNANVDIGSVEGGSSGYTFLTLVITILLLWALSSAGYKAYKKYGEEKEWKAPEYLALDENDHYQRLF